MKIIYLFNRYRSVFGGEPFMVDTIITAMRKLGHDVILETRDSATIQTIKEKISAFGSSFYSRTAKQEFAQLLEQERPDIVHVHNLYPLFSPSILEVCHEQDIPVVMSIHNFSLTCPIALHVYNGTNCTRCLGGKEYWCALLNCADSRLKSLNYAIRNAFARKRRFFMDNVNIYIAATEFMKTWLIDNGYDSEKIVIIPHMLSIPEESANPAHGTYALFAGRLEQAKGVGVFLDAAAKTPDIPCRIAGDGFMRDAFVSQAPSNVTFLGLIPTEEMHNVYSKARFVVFPSSCYEGFGLVAAEALSHGVPVIAANVGGVGEIVEDGVNGYLFESGDDDQLALLMNKLWNDPGLCRKLGVAGRQKALETYGELSFSMSYDALYKGLAKNKLRV